MRQLKLRVEPDGWVTGIDHVASPNADARPDGTEVSLIVIHNISLPPGCYGDGSVERLFTNQPLGSAQSLLERISGVRVSAHFFIARSGRCSQFVSCRDRAWHAGVSTFRGRARCNDYSIGIELEGTDFEPFEDVQYAALNAILAAIVSAYPVDAIVGHSDVASDRKTDPGPFFRWDALRVPRDLIAR
jgi:AmpD protein